MLYEMKFDETFQNWIKSHAKSEVKTKTSQDGGNYDTEAVLGFTGYYIEETKIIDNIWIDNEYDSGGTLTSLYPSDSQSRYGDFDSLWYYESNYYYLHLGNDGKVYLREFNYSAMDTAATDEYDITYREGTFEGTFKDTKLYEYTTPFSLYEDFLSDMYSAGGDTVLYDMPEAIFAAKDKSPKETFEMLKNKFIASSSLDKSATKANINDFVTKFLTAKQGVAGIQPPFGDGDGIKVLDKLAGLNDDPDYVNAFGRLTNAIQGTDDQYAKLIDGNDSLLIYEYLLGDFNNSEDTAAQVDLMFSHMHNAVLSAIKYQASMLMFNSENEGRYHKMLTSDAITDGAYSGGESDYVKFKSILGTLLDYFWKNEENLTYSEFIQQKVLSASSSDLHILVAIALIATCETPADKSYTDEQLTKAYEELSQIVKNLSIESENASSPDEVSS